MNRWRTGCNTEDEQSNCHVKSEQINAHGIKGKEKEEIWAKEKQLKTRKLYLWLMREKK
jgi:hypothetical protein